MPHAPGAAVAAGEGVMNEDDDAEAGVERREERPPMGVTPIGSGVWVTGRLLLLEATEGNENPGDKGTPSDCDMLGEAKSKLVRSRAVRPVAVGSVGTTAPDTTLSLCLGSLGMWDAPGRS